MGRGRIKWLVNFILLFKAQDPQDSLIENWKQIENQEILYSSFYILSLIFNFTSEW